MAQTPSANDVTKAEARAEAKVVEALDNGGDVEGAKADKLKVAQDEIAKAVKAATDSDGAAKVKDGVTIGLDGKNPVSNENPNPTAVRNVYSLF